MLRSLCQSGDYRRQFAGTLPERPSRLRFLIRGPGSEFTRDFDAIFASDGVEVIEKPEQQKSPFPGPS